MFLYAFFLLFLPALLKTTRKCEINVLCIVALEKPAAAVLMVL
jgi:hypothetical protein